MKNTERAVLLITLVLGLVSIVLSGLGSVPAEWVANALGWSLTKSKIVLTIAIVAIVVLVCFFVHLYFLHAPLPGVSRGTGLSRSDLCNWLHATLQAVEKSLEGHRQNLDDETELTWNSQRKHRSAMRVLAKDDGLLDCHASWLVSSVHHNTNDGEDLHRHLEGREKLADGIRRICAHLRVWWWRPAKDAIPRAARETRELLAKVSSARESLMTLCPQASSETKGEGGGNSK